MSVSFRREDLDALSTRLLAEKFHGVIDEIASRLCDVIVERVQPEVLRRVDVQAISNVATLRAGVNLGERLAEHSAGKK